MPPALLFGAKGFFLSVSKFIADLKKEKKEKKVSHTRKFERPSRASAFRIPFSNQNEMARAQRIGARVYTSLSAKKRRDIKVAG